MQEHKQHQHLYTNLQNPIFNKCNFKIMQADFFGEQKQFLTITKQTEDLMQLSHACHQPPYVTAVQPDAG